MIVRFTLSELALELPATTPEDRANTIRRLVALWQERGVLVHGRLVVGRTPWGARSRGPAPVDSDGVGSALEDPAHPRPGSSAA